MHTTSDQAAADLASGITDKTVIITGVSPTGIGADAARAIFQQNPKLLILASRNLGNINAVINEIRGSKSVENVKPLLLDLSDLMSVRKAADELLRMTAVVDSLINNAGVMMVPNFKTTSEGIEWHFAINHVGHFLFTNLIMPALLKSQDGACVVNVSSAAHRGSVVHFEDINFNEGKNYEKFLAYAQSKSANLLFSVGLTQKLGGKNLRSFGVDPGGIPTTGISRDISMEERIERGWWDRNGNPNTELIPYKSVEQGSANYIVAAFDRTIDDQSGACIADSAIDPTTAPHALDPESAKKLWALSEKLVGQEFSYN